MVTTRASIPSAYDPSLKKVSTKPLTKKQANKAKIKKQNSTGKKR